MPFVPPDWFNTIPWATREDPIDPQSPLVEIRPGELDTETTALRRIWYQFQGRPEWQRIIGLLGELAGVLEHGLGSIDQARYVSTAEGDVLDEIGALVGRPRQGLSDALYRLAIRAEAASTVSSGTINEIIELMQSLVGPDVRVREFWPATILISAPDIATDVFLVLLEVIADMPAAGVAALLSTWDSAAVFGYDSTTGGTGTVGAYDSTTGGADEVSFYATGQPIG